MRGHPRIPRLRTVLRGQPIKNNENNESPTRSGVLAFSHGISPRRRARTQLLKSGSRCSHVYACLRLFSLFLLCTLSVLSVEELEGFTLRIVRLKHWKCSSTKL